MPNYKQKSSNFIMKMQNQESKFKRRMISTQKCYVDLMKFKNILNSTKKLSAQSIFWRMNFPSLSKDKSKWKIVKIGVKMLAKNFKG